MNVTINLAQQQDENFEGREGKFLEVSVLFVKQHFQGFKNINLSFKKAFSIYLDAEFDLKPSLKKVGQYPLSIYKYLHRQPSNLNIYKKVSIDPNQNNNNNMDI